MNTTKTIVGVGGRYMGGVWTWSVIISRECIPVWKWPDWAVGELGSLAVAGK